MGRTPQAPGAGASLRAVPPQGYPLRAVPPQGCPPLRTVPSGLSQPRGVRNQPPPGPGPSPASGRAQEGSAPRSAPRPLPGAAVPATRPLPNPRPSPRIAGFVFVSSPRRAERPGAGLLGADPASAAPAGEGSSAAAMALAAQALRLLCASGGCLEQGELQRWLPGWPTAEQMAVVLGDAQRFTVVRRPGEAGLAAAAGGEAAAAVVVVVATSPVRLCQEYGAGCEGLCGRLHLCKYHLKGLCRNQRPR